MIVLNKVTVSVVSLCCVIACVGYWQLAYKKSMNDIQPVFSSAQEEVQVIEQKLQEIAEKMTHIYKASQDIASDKSLLMQQRDGLEMQLAGLEKQLAVLLSEHQERYGTNARTI